MTVFLILVAVLCLAWANGANDNFKGVATLFGSGTTNYRGALTWATVTTLAGSLTAVFLAASLLKAFTGKGIVDPALASTARYGAAVAIGAGVTVLLATRIGMPISTTHSLVGALIGSGSRLSQRSTTKNLAVDSFCRCSSVLSWLSQRP